MCELVNWIIILMLECSKIVWPADYIYVPMQYYYAVSSYHRYCNYAYSLNYLLLCASHHRTVALCCAVNSDSGTAQL